MAGNVNNTINSEVSTFISSRPDLDEQNASDESILDTQDRVERLTTTVKSSRSRRYSFNNNYENQRKNDLSSRAVYEQEPVQQTSSDRPNTYVVRNPGDRRYSYGKPRPGSGNTRDPDQGGNYAVSSTRAVRHDAKNLARSRRMAAVDSLYQRQDNNQYSYGTTFGHGQLMSFEEAEESLFFGDIAHALMDNGFFLSPGQQRRIKEYRHEFSDEFAAYDSVRSDHLYQQAAIVDALISNGATLTPEQEQALGISDFLTSS